MEKEPSSSEQVLMTDRDPDAIPPAPSEDAPKSSEESSMNSYVVSLSPFVLS